jgi:glycosyltransferase involved in cell wall biosynthesis
MKIVYLAAGAGGMYCGSCLHDNTLAKALSDLGEQVLLTPTYTPLKTDEEDVSLPRIFFGGINVYLQQKSSLFRHTPWWIDGMLDRPGLLRAVTKGAAGTDPEHLGDLTVSMLSGDEGRQSKELEKLVRWLSDEVKPDVVHISNSMLLGMARRFRQELRVPVVCSLTGEDIFLEKLSPPYYEQARALLVERSRDATAFVALNRYYADYMIDYMRLDASRVHVIPHGLQLAGHAARARSAGDRPFRVGYLARICADKGFHLLVEAFLKLATDDRLTRIELKAAGYLGKQDRRYFAEQQRRIVEAGLGDQFEYLGEPDRDGKIAFLQSLDAMALPTIYRESKGLSVLEAWANGVPVVLPEHGSFPEMIADTQAGLLFPPEDIDALAEQIARLALDADLAHGLGQAGYAAVNDRYHAGIMAERTLALYRDLTDIQAQSASE